MSEYNAPEIHGVEKPAGMKAMAEMIRLIGGKRVHMITRGKDKYGRWLCTASTGTGTHPHPNPLPEGEGQKDKDISIGLAMRAYLKDYPGRDKYQKHIAVKK